VNAQIYLKRKALRKNMKDFSILNLNDELQNYEENTCKKLTEDQQNQYKEIHRALI